MYLSAAISAADDSVPVLITGCVMDGDGGKMVPTDSIYWLSTTKGLKQQVGRKVEVVGTYSPSRDVGKTGTIKITADASGQESIALENGAKTAEATTTDASGVTGVVGTSGTTTEITQPYRRLQVKTLKRLAENCVAR